MESTGPPTQALVESRYLELLWRLQLHRWRNYAEGHPLDLSEVSTDLHELATEANDVAFTSDRRGAILRGIVRRLRVDAHPDVAALMDRLGDRSNYGSVPDTITVGWRRKLARAMEADVIALLTLRNELSRQLGTPSYGHLVAESEGYDQGAMIRFARAERAKRLHDTAERVRAADVTDATWFDGLERMSVPGDYHAADSARALASQLGLGDLCGAITWVERDQPITGYDCPVSVPNDIRILIQPVVSSDGLTTVFHELGHGLAHAANESNGIFLSWDALHDETMAIIMQHIGVELRFAAGAAAAAMRVAELETTRMATSFLFEVEVNENPGRARDLYLQWYQPMVPVEDPAVWAADSFRTEDPFYIHTYLLGHIVAHATIGFLRSSYGDDYRRWGAWLRTIFYRDGRQRSLFDKLVQLNEFCPEGVLSLRRS